MSAEFIFMKTPVFIMTEDRKKVLAEELSNLTPQDYENLRDELFFDDESDVEIQQGCLDIIEQVMDIPLYTADIARDNEYNENGERMEILYTGGMSYGDSPTGSYDLVSSLCYVPVAETIERFAVEDCKVEA